METTGLKFRYNKETKQHESGDFVLKENSEGNYVCHYQGAAFDEKEKFADAKAACEGFVPPLLDDDDPAESPPEIPPAPELPASDPLPQGDEAQEAPPQELKEDAPAPEITPLPALTVTWSYEQEEGSVSTTVNDRWGANVGDDEFVIARTTIGGSAGAILCLRRDLSPTANHSRLDHLLRNNGAPVKYSTLGEAFAAVSAWVSERYNVTVADNSGEMLEKDSTPKTAATNGTMHVSHTGRYPRLRNVVPGTVSPWTKERLVGKGEVLRSNKGTHEDAWGSPLATANALVNAALAGSDSALTFKDLMVQCNLTRGQVRYLHLQGLLRQGLIEEQRIGRTCYWNVTPYGRTVWAGTEE